MSETTGLVRLTVLRGARRADLAVPGAVSVADLLPELVASVGALDPYTVHGGYRLSRPGGATLRHDEGLTAQGVEDGDVLSVDLGADATAARVYDDVVEAVADAVERQTRPWSPEASRRTALVASLLMLALSALVLFGLRSGGLVVALGAGVVSLLLVTAAAVVGRGQRVHDAAVAVGWAAVVFAAVSGTAVLPERPWSGLPLLASGLAALVVGSLGVAAVERHRSLLVPAIALGGLAAAVGTVVVSGVEIGRVVACAITLVVIAGSVVPWMSVTTTRLRVPQPRSDAEILADPTPVDAAEVDRQVRLGREVLVALTVTVGAVLVLSVPLLVALGLSGTLLAGAAAVTLLLRTRQYRDTVEVRVGTVAAVLALAVTVLAAALSHPSWRALLAGVVLVAGAVLLAVAVTPRTANVRLGRAGDLVEAVCLVALLPLLAAALGAFG